MRRLTAAFVVVHAACLPCCNSPSSKSDGVVPSASAVAPVAQAASATPEPMPSSVAEHRTHPKGAHQHRVKEGSACHNGLGKPIACPRDTEDYVCALDDYEWIVPPHSGCDSPPGPEERIYQTPTAPAESKPATPSVAHPGSHPVSNMGRCAPGEVGGVGYVCVNGEKHPS
jgi:hypothetical protein